MAIDNIHGNTKNSICQHLNALVQKDEGERPMRKCES